MEFTICRCPPQQEFAHARRFLGDTAAESRLLLSRVPARLPNGKSCCHALLPIKIERELAMTKLLTLMKTCALLMVGAIVGMALRPPFVDGPTAMAQEKSTPSPEEQLRKLKIELPAVSKPTN